MYVADGRAQWTDEDLREEIFFVEDNPRHLAVKKQHEAAVALMPGELATLDAIAGVPVLSPVKLITDTNSPITRKGRRQRGRCGPVVIIRSHAA